MAQKGIPTPGSADSFLHDVFSSAGIFRERTRGMELDKRVISVDFDQ